MNADVIAMFERMAEHGTAPESGCTLFGVGFEDAFERLRRVYIERRFQRGGSAEKFVVGPFGSGKTHFLRQLLELARDNDCVTAEIALSKEVDFTSTMIVYRELCREVRAPTESHKGLGPLIKTATHRIGGQAVDPSDGTRLVRAWAARLTDVEFEYPHFPHVVRQAVEALIEDDDPGFRRAVNWLSGGCTDRTLSKELGLQVITHKEESLFAKRSMLSLFQLVRAAGYRGTVLGFDEAEQGLTVNKKKTQQILSMLQSDINAISDLQQGSALVVYALTHDLFAQMEGFAALQQRVADPDPARTFWDGDTYAPRLDLNQREDPGDLEHIGSRLVQLLYEHEGQHIATPIEETLRTADKVAKAVASEDLSRGNRRTMVKRTCSMLLRLLDSGELVEPGSELPPARQGEV